MLAYFNSKKEAVEFVDDLLKAFPNASQSITITSQEKYVVCYAPTATEELSGGTDGETVSTFFETQSNT